jgi:2-polyprenyl-3-methyl-5-hydroxy-6-metoxy-1,4-benzoquinol methylase
VTIGKPLDVLSLKGASLDEVREYSSFLAETAAELYASRENTFPISRCPCCESDAGELPEAFRIFEIPYKLCRNCGHVFVGRQPKSELLDQLFSESAEHASVYTDKKTTENRMAQVVRPKFEWLQQVYHAHYGREFQSLTDVGAGGGHFVEQCRRMGVEAEGYEISAASRCFAREVFSIELKENDFLSVGDTRSADIVTMWGLLEYTPEPRNFMLAAQRCLSDGSGMVVVEVPRLDCLGTAVQTMPEALIARHLDPTSHVNCFSDSSLATLLFEAGLAPVAVWYFGMDAYELLTQLAIRQGRQELSEEAVDMIPTIQRALDSAQLCDDIVVACVPRH